MGGFGWISEIRWVQKPKVTLAEYTSMMSDGVTLYHERRPMLRPVASTGPESASDRVIVK
jgi:hypothetical protein